MHIAHAQCSQQWTYCSYCNFNKLVLLHA